MTLFLAGFSSHLCLVLITLTSRTHTNTQLLHSKDSWLGMGRRNPRWHMEVIDKRLPPGDRPPRLNSAPPTHIPIGRNLLRKTKDPLRRTEFHRRALLLLPAGKYLYHGDRGCTLDVPRGNHGSSPAAPRDIGRDSAKVGGVFHIVAYYQDFGGIAHGPALYWSAKSNGVPSFVL